MPTSNKTGNSYTFATTELCHKMTSVPVNKITNIITLSSIGYSVSDDICYLCIEHHHYLADYFFANLMAIANISSPIFCS